MSTRNRLFALISAALLALLTAGCDGMVITDNIDNEGVQKAPTMPVYYAFTTPPEESGLHVRALNNNFTRCANGAEQPFCEYEVLDFSHAGLDDETAEAFQYYFTQGKGIVRGWLDDAVTAREFGQVTTLYVDEAWLDMTPRELVHDVYAVNAVDLRCVRAPCPDFEAKHLNQSAESLLHEVWLETSEAPADTVEDGYTQMQKEEILISGPVYEYTGSQSIAPETLPGSRILEAWTFYFLLQD